MKCKSQEKCINIERKEEEKGRREQVRTVSLGQHGHSGQLHAESLAEY
jgi:hypothetical protein